MTPPCDHCTKPTTGAHLCTSCETTLAYALANIAAYDADLRTVAERRTRYGTQAGKPSIGKTQPLPVDMRFVDTANHGGAGRGTALAEDVRNTLVGWCRVVAEHNPPRPGTHCAGVCLHASCAVVRRTAPPEDTVPSMVRYLARQMRAIRREDWIGDMLDELLYLEKRLARFVDRPPERWYAGKCDCGVDLYAQADRGAVRCDGCSAEYDVATRRDFLLAEACDCLVTASEAAGALIAWTDYDGTVEKLTDRIRKWRDRDQLEVRDVTSLNGRDRHLYRLGDIQSLLIGAAQARQARTVAG